MKAKPILELDSPANIKLFDDHIALSDLNETLKYKNIKSVTLERGKINWLVTILINLVSVVLFDLLDETCREDDRLIICKKNGKILEFEIDGINKSKIKKAIRIIENN